MAYRYTPTPFVVVTPYKRYLPGSSTLSSECTSDVMIQYCLPPAYDKWTGLPSRLRMLSAEMPPGTSQLPTSLDSWVEWRIRWGIRQVDSPFPLPVALCFLDLFSNKEQNNRYPKPCNSPRNIDRHLRFVYPRLFCRFNIICWSWRFSFLTWEMIIDYFSHLCIPKYKIIIYAPLYSQRKDDAGINNVGKIIISSLYIILVPTSEKTISCNLLVSRFWVELSFDVTYSPTTWMLTADIVHSGL